MPLNKMSARKALTITAKGRHGDGGGLYLSVGKGEARSWCFLYRDRTTGRLRELGLGPAEGPEKAGFSLAEARDKAADARKALRDGLDPLAIKTAERKLPTFGDFADAHLIKNLAPKFTNPTTLTDWKRCLEVHANSLRPVRIDRVTTQDVLAVVEPLWLTKNKTADGLRSKIATVLDAATAGGKRTGPNPAAWEGLLEHLLPEKVKPVNHAAAHHSEVPGIVRALRANRTTINLALEFVILTAARSGEVRGMRVREIDFASALWTCPAERMKAGIEHTVPLSSRALEILTSLIGPDAGADEFVFKGRDPTKPLGENSLLPALKDVAPNATTHGFRSSFRTYAGNVAQFPREVCEHALAHAVGSRVEQAYQRETLLEKRRPLMDQWAAYVEGTLAVDNVVPMVRPA